MSEVWDFSELTGKSQEDIKKIKKDMKDVSKVNKEMSNKNVSKEDVSMTQEVQLSIQTDNQKKKALTITLDKSLIEAIDKTVSKIKTNNKQGLRSRVINMALTKVFK